MKVLVLGAGKMVGAIVEGLCPSTSLADWCFYSPGGASARSLAEKVGGRFTADLDSVSPDWIIIGCKPQQLKDLAATIKGKYDDALFISLLAAIPEKDQLETLKVKRLVRAMPNLSVKFQEGVTLLSSVSAQKDLGEVEKLFSKLGMAKVTDEDSLQELTLLTGSGPALFYEFTLNLAQSFSSLSEKEREALARQVLLGAGLSAKKEEMSLQKMIDAVTSKGGVTIAVLESFRSKGLLDVIKYGVKGGLDRTRELMKSILQS